MKVRDVISFPDAFCVVVLDKHGDRHAAEVDLDDDLGVAAIDLARSVGGEAGEPITYYVVASDDPGAARLLPSHASLGSHYTMRLPAYCGACDDTGRCDDAAGRRRWCDCANGREGAADAALATAEAAADGAA